MTPRAPRVSVIVPAWYSHGTLAASLAALREQTYRDFETILVNSSPEPCTAAIVQRDFPEVIFVQSATRLLPHAARNRGVALARGDLLVFTDPDRCPRPDWLAWLVAAHDAGHAVVGGSIEMRGRGRFARGVHLCKFYWLLSGLPAGPRWIVPSANVCYARWLWEQLGPLAGDLFAGDAVQCWRAAARGARPWFEPRAVTEHEHDGSWRSLWWERFARGQEFARTRASFERWSRGRAVAYLLLLPLLVPLVLARAAGCAVRGGWGRWYLPTLPVQLVGQLAWCLGESIGHGREAAGARAIQPRRESLYGVA